MNVFGLSFISANQKTGFYMTETSVMKELKKKWNWSMMTAHIECAKGTFKILTLLTENCNLFSLGHRYSEYYLFSLFINRSFSLKIYTADIISP